MKKIEWSQMPKDIDKMECVYHNQQSGACIYKSKDGIYYWPDTIGLFCGENLEELIKAERQIDPRLGWN